MAGNFGCSKNAKNTVSNMKDKKPELVIPLGDLSYSISANCWLDLISPFNDRLKVTLGYHDVNDGASKLNQYEQTFGLKKHYDSFDYRHVHFVIMSSLSKFDKGSEQYMFISEDLKKASEDKEIDWIIVTSYSPLYTSPSKHTAEKDMRDIYHPLFEQYGVDLVLQAHNHNYQRTYLISYNSGDNSKPTISNQFTTGYSGQSDGMVFAIAGTGGEGFYPLESQAAYTATQFTRFGFLNIEISNGNPYTKLTGTFYDNKGDEVRDQFTIEKEIQVKKLVDKS
ncbi:MAG: metallophosphoesterase [Thermoproteota archaeon]|nr:metallophosphoesterase [Thermoproteota archaeon]